MRSDETRELVTRGGGAVELLSEPDRGDAVNQVLRLVRVRSTVYCRSLMAAPWGFGVEAHGNPAFHVVTAGSCWLEVEDEPDQIALEPGDLVLLPAGKRHWVRDQPESHATELEEILADTQLDLHRRLHYGGSGPITTLLCGGFSLQSAGAHPILRVLPPFLRIRGRAGRPVPWLAATLRLLNAEVESDAPGAEEVVSRLADALLTQALRVALAELEGVHGISVRALGDRQIAAAIALIHSEPERRWTVGDLASEVALSRSAFSARFRHLLGESPKRYVTRTRLAHASTLLHQTDAPLAEIALRAGYSSEFAFSKAFKRVFGLAPGAYRGEPASVPGLTPPA